AGPGSRTCSATGTGPQQPPAVPAALPACPPARPPVSWKASLPLVRESNAHEATTLVLRPPRAEDLSARGGPGGARRLLRPAPGAPDGDGVRAGERHVPRGRGAGLVVRPRVRRARDGLRREVRPARP